MMESFENIKEGLLSIYEMEVITAKGKKDADRAFLLGKAMDIIRSMDTKTELLEGLTDKSVELFKPIREVERVGGFLKDMFSVKDLLDNNVYIDKLPTGILPKDTTCLLINSTPHLKDGELGQDVYATILGRWYLDVLDADVTLLHGAHVNLWDSRAIGHRLVENASMIRRQDEYFQPIHRINSEKEFRDIEGLLDKHGRFALLEHLIPDPEDIPAISLSDLYATTTLRKGDDILAETGHFTLVRNEWERSYTLFEKHNVGKVIEKIKEADHRPYLSDDLIPVLADLYRDTFLRLPGERMVIGENTRNEPVTLSFNADTYKFKVENLCPKNSKNESLRFYDELYMDWERTLKGQISFILTRFEGKILPLKEQKAEIKQKGNGHAI